MCTQTLETAEGEDMRNSSLDRVTIKPTCFLVTLGTKDIIRSKGVYSFIQDESHSVSFCSSSIGYLKIFLSFENILDFDASRSRTSLGLFPSINLDL